MSARKPSRPRTAVALVLVAAFFVSLGAGYAAAKLKIVDTTSLRRAAPVELSRTLESKVPGYGSLLARYKTWHNAKLVRFMAGRDRLGLGLLIFFNNFVVANVTMAVRALLVVPLALYPVGRFVQGAAIAGLGATPLVAVLLLAEFGGYLAVILGALSLSLWTLFPKRFRFSSRGQALRSGWMFLLVCWAVSGVFLAAGAILESGLMLGR